MYMCVCICTCEAMPFLSRHFHDPQTHLFVSLFLTGVGAKIGGFAGDALPVARVMSSLVDTLITHPNVILYWCEKLVLNPVQFQAYFALYLWIYA